jgi:Ser/Thr protein kinase RdoA (MazF antagonist)
VRDKADAKADEAIIRNDVLPEYEGISADATVRAFGTGLINRTYLVEDGNGAGKTRLVLQWVNPIFPISIHDNIEAVTRHLEKKGMWTPHLVRTRERRLCLELGEKGVWRFLTHIGGASFDVISSTRQAHAGGALVGRFHAALDSLEHTFIGQRLGVHDTPKHLARLREAVQTRPDHRLAGPVRTLAEAILARAEQMPPLPVIDDRPCHGDLKFNNLLFAGERGAAAEEPVCLIDLDTIGPASLAFELGDAWRSWCNRNGENNPEASLDLDIFAASLEGYKQGLDRPLAAAERTALLLGVDWVSLELAARFAADAVFESYFGWDPTKFAGRGEHNLLRARGQWSLHEALTATRTQRSKLLGL